MSRPARRVHCRAGDDEAPPAEWRAGPGLGFEFGMGDLDYTAARVRVEAARVVRRVSPVTTLSLVGALAAAHPSGEEDVAIVIPAFPPIVRSATIEWDANVFEVVPAARLTYSASPKVSFFADGGLGLTYTAARVYVPSGLAGAAQDDVVSDGVGGVVRLAGGLVITPSPALRIGLEVIGLHLRFGDGPGTGFALGASLSHRPATGSG